MKRYDMDYDTWIGGGADIFEVEKEDGHWVKYDDVKELEKENQSLGMFEEENQSLGILISDLEKENERLREENKRSNAQINALEIRIMEWAAENERLREDCEKDYNDMRKFQYKYIESDKELANLKEKTNRARSETLGYAYQWICEEADKGRDIREIEVPELLEAAVRDLEWEAY